MSIAQKLKPEMDNIRAVGLIEGFEFADTEDDMVEAWQFLIDNGMVWKLQGCYGRAARELIDSGTCIDPMDRR